ncbi:ABC transporter permease [Hymenobacter negativus]|uniref:ABC transporter permease subunit n=1 Tax=Hymenobacter negativus TaxID=2795026 RepID=A0ABS3QP15_9BACT|nr:ABC transporter permease subunit [Hymenobacter negativus]MBO2013024.1 ABC transporter permease subunit [Hymenobacter negativus]
MRSDFASPGISPPDPLSKKEGAPVRESDSEPRKSGAPSFLERGSGGRAVFLAAALILLFGLPFVLLGLLAVGENWRFPQAMPPAYSLDAVRSLLAADNDLLLGLGRSLLLAGTVAVVATAGGFALARAMAQSRSTARWEAASYLPYALPPVLLAVLIQPFIIRLHLSGSVGGVLVGLLLVALPFATLLMRSFWSAQTTEYEHLARTLGCTPGQALRQVLLPLAWPLLRTALVQTFLLAWFDFGLTNVLSVGKVRTLTVQVFTYIGEANAPLAAVASLLLLLPPVVLLLVNKSALLRKP